MPANRDDSTTDVAGLIHAGPAPAPTEPALSTALRTQQWEDATLQRLLESATQGIGSINAESRIVTANPSLERMFGWETGQLTGQSLEVLIPASLRERHARNVAAYWTSPRSRPMGTGLRLEGRRRDGTTFPIEVALNHVPTPDGGRAMVFVTDISERERSEVALREAHARLETRTEELRLAASELTLVEQRAREDLARTLHDHLQQLLFSTRLKLDRLAMRLADSPRQETALVIGARQDLDDAIATVRSLSVELAPPLLHDAGLPAALTWLAGWMSERFGLTVDLTAAPEATPVDRGMRTLVFESIRELLFNAVKHAQVTHVTVRLSLTPSSKIEVTIADHGLGFDPASLWPAAPARHGGTGLFSIRERLALFGGEFEIDSSPGRGTRFTIRVPQGGSQPARDAASPTPEGMQAPLRILLADDHTLVREGLRELLSEHTAFQVVGEATTGYEAITQARVLRPDVVLMDVSMPELDGITATRLIRAELPSTQVFGLSTQERSDQLHAIETAGAVGYFAKGEDTQHLIERLLRTWQERESHRST